MLLWRKGLLGLIIPEGIESIKTRETVQQEHAAYLAVRKQSDHISPTHRKWRENRKWAPVGAQARLHSLQVP